MKVKDIIKSLQEWAPLSYQESYDNSGLLVGDRNLEITEILITLDVTEDVMREAIDSNCNLIIAHHPLIFNGLKKITGDHWVERCVTMAIKNDIAIYALHTNLDNVATGVNQMIAEKLKLRQTSVLSPKSGMLSKLVTFVPDENLDEVLNALYEAGAGIIGEYEHCSFRVEGTGTFRPGEKANPHIGEPLKDEEVTEKRVEMIFPSNVRRGIVEALKKAHPYEEVAYYLSVLSNKNVAVGSGLMGHLEHKMSVGDFIVHLKDQMQLKVIRRTAGVKKKVQKVAVCGGSGSFLLSKAIQAGADVFVSGDFKYHDFFETENKIMIMDIGHYESEVFTKELVCNFLREKFANIALRLSEVNTNPIIYD